MKNFELKIGQVTYSYNSSSRFNLHIEHSNGYYDCVLVPFGFDNQEQFEEYVIDLDIKYWSTGAMKK